MFVKYICDILVEFKTKYPDIPLHIIPGISSINSGAAIAQIPLALKKEALLINKINRFWKYKSI